MAARPAELLVGVQGVWKRFCRDLRRALAYGARDVVRELSGRRRPVRDLRKGEFWGLRDVSFELRRGESVGLVGANGAGKSTLLRLVGGLIKPDAGLIRTSGRLVPLIAQGAGFNPVLTGRENAGVCLALLGLSSHQIEARLPGVFEFSELDAALDASVQTYSSGMVARLGFACAIHADPDVLLVDEVLAVGDLAFRAKCYERLAELRRGGVGLVLVSHNSSTVLNVCDRAIYLRQGRLVKTGGASEVVAAYEDDVVAPRGDGPEAAAELDPDVQIEGVGFVDERGERLEPLEMGRPASLRVTVRARRALDEVGLGVVIRPQDGGPPSLELSSAADRERLDLPAGLSELRLDLAVCALPPGRYGAAIQVERRRQALVSLPGYRFSVRSDSPLGRSRFHQPRRWSIDAPASGRAPSLRRASERA